MLLEMEVIGRLTKDISEGLRTVQVKGEDTQVVNFTLAVQDDINKEETTFVTCTAWRGTAVFLAQYGKKGNKLYVKGKPQARPWMDKNNKPQASLELSVDKVYVLDFPARDESAATPSGARPTASAGAGKKQPF